MYRKLLVGLHELSGGTSPDNVPLNFEKSGNRFVGKTISVLFSQDQSFYRKRNKLGRKKQPEFALIPSPSFSLKTKSQYPLALWSNNKAAAEVVLAGNKNAVPIGI